MADDVTVKLGGDSAALVAALKQGGDAFHQFVTKASTESDALNSKLKSLSGGDLLREANQYVEAVQHIGGATKLTADEKAKLNTQLQAALDKYKALGQQAPAALQQLAKDTELVGQKTDVTEQKVSKLASAQQHLGSEVDAAKSKFGLYVAGFFTAEAAFTAVGKAGQLVVDFLSDSITEATQAEAVQKKLTAAITAQGFAIPGLGERYDELSGHFQKTTVHADDLIKEMEALLIQVGGVMPSQMEGALQAAADLSAGLGIDLQSATLAVGKAMNGEVGSLKRYGIEIDETALKAQGAGVIFDAVNAKFGGQAQAEVDTYAGKLAQLKNTWSDLKEETGKYLLTHPAVETALNAVANAMANEGKEAGGALPNVKRFFEVFFGLDVLASAGRVAGLMQEGENMARRMGEIKSPFALPSGRGIPGVGATAAELQQFDEESAKFKKRLDDQDAAIEAHTQKLRALREQMSGSAARKEMADLVEAWRGLAEAEKKEPSNIQYIVDAYDTLRARLRPDQLPKDLENLWLKAQAGFENLQKIDIFGQLPIDKSIPKFGIEEGFENKQPIDIFKLIGFDKNAPTAPLANWSQMFNGWAGKLPAQIANAFTGGGGWKGALQATGSTFGGDFMSHIFGEAGKSGLTKGMTGFMGQFLSSAMPIVGALAGPLIGKLFDGFKKPEFKEIAKDVGRQWGTSISDGLAQQIEKDAKEKFGKDRVAGSLFNLDSIIAEDGGLAAGNLPKYTQKLRDVFSMIDQGKFSVSDAAKVIDKNWSAFVAAHTDSNGRISNSLKEIIKLADQFGVKSKEIAAWQQGQAASAIAGFNAVVSGSAMTTREELANLETQALASYNAAVKAGVGQAEALQQLGPSLDAIRAKWKALGLESDNAAFRALDTQRAMAQGNPALLSAVDGLKQQMIALSNLGALDQQTFAAMGETAALMYTRLQSEAEKLGKTGAEGTKAALAPMQGYLQQAAAQAKELGIPLDDNTLELIRQSQELGLWKEQAKSSMEVAADAMGAVADKLDQIIDKLFGVGDAAGYAASQIAGIGAGGDYTGVIPEPGSNTGPAPRELVGHRGGYVTARQILHDGGPVRDVRATLQTGEFVVNRQTTSAALTHLRNLNRERTPEGVAAAIARANVVRGSFGGSAARGGDSPFVRPGADGARDVTVNVYPTIQALDLTQHETLVKKLSMETLRTINGGGEHYQAFQRLAKGAVGTQRQAS